MTYKSLGEYYKEVREGRNRHALNHMVLGPEWGAPAGLGWWPQPVVNKSLAGFFH